MSVTKSGDVWYGDGFDDLADYIRDYGAGGYEVAVVKRSVCGQCAGTTFGVQVDETGDECAQRWCLTCDDIAFIGDSEEYWESSETDDCACPCGGEEFEAGVGFALRPDGEVRWLSIGLRCLKDGQLGVYADWKIDYTPSRHLLESA